MNQRHRAGKRNEHWSYRISPDFVEPSTIQSIDTERASALSSDRKDVSTLSLDFGGVKRTPSSNMHKEGVDLVDFFLFFAYVLYL